MRVLIPLVLLLSACGSPDRSAGAPLLGGIGSYRFPVGTGNELAQRYFDQGLALCHGFNHDEGARAFVRGAELAPACAMMHWGVAYALSPNFNLGDEGVDYAGRARAALARARDLAASASQKERDLIEATYRAIIEKDAAAFKTGLARLHPGANWRMTCVVLLCRLVDKIHLLHTPEVAGLPQDERAEAIAGPTHHTFYLDFGDRFSTAEALALHQRFTPLSERLRQDGEKVHQHYAGVLAALKPDADPPNFRSRPLRTFHTEMPSGFGVDEFVRSWDG